MSHRHNISLTDELQAQLKAHPDFHLYKTIPALIRHFIEIALSNSSDKMLNRMQQDLTSHEIAWCQEQYDKEKYHYDIHKQFTTEAIPPRSLCEITKELYLVMQQNSVRPGFLTKEQLETLK